MQNKQENGGCFVDENNDFLCLCGGSEALQSRSRDVGYKNKNSVKIRVSKQAFDTIGTSGYL